ncbi:MAG TPA: pyridoxal phosphate-dependent aminotransferase, partial [Bacteroidia bacterium]
MKYKRMPIEAESPEQLGYDTLDCNLAESSVHDLTFGELGLDLRKVSLSYGDHLGKPELRELIASAHKGLRAGDVLLTQGAASALFIVATSLLSKKDRLAVMFPNYATNIETPGAIGCTIDRVELKFEDDFKLDIPSLEKKIKKNTRYISITYPHNPTGVTIGKKELLELIRIAEKKNIFLLVDETYRELNRAEEVPLAASLSNNAISISSLSKAYGLPGIRMGWLITKNKSLQELFLAAKEQIFVCNSVADEEIAYGFLLKKEKFAKKINERVLQNFAVVDKWMGSSKYLEWVRPGGGVVCFPRMRHPATINIAEFYSLLNKKYKTLVGPGHWFGMPRSY